MIVSILKILASIFTIYLLLCLVELHEGGQVLVERTDSGRGRRRQFVPMKELFRLNLLDAAYYVAKDISEVFRRAYRPRYSRGLGDFVGSVWQTCKTDLKDLFKIVWSWLWPILTGFAMGLAWFKGSVVILIMILAVQVLLTVWWFKNGSNWKEYLVFSLVMVGVFLATSSVVYTTAVLWRKSVFWTSFFNLLPSFALVTILGICLINAIYSYAKYFKIDWMKTLSAILTGILVIILIVMLICNIHW